MSTFSGIPVLSIPATISVSPTNGATLPWNGLNKSYQWSAVLSISTQSTSGLTTRQKFSYNGLDVNVGMWIANLTNGLAWQIVSISAKTASSVSVTLQDVFRYNTYRDPTHTGNGRPPTGNYVVFQLSSAGLPMVDPAPSGIGTNFLATLTSRFQWINNQYDFPLSQPDGTSITFQYGDVIAIDDAMGKYVLADGTNLNVIGTCTAIDDTGKIFTVHTIQKIVDTLDSLPGNVGDLIYTDPGTPGKLTTTAGGTEVYLKIRQYTSSTTASNSFGATTSQVTTAGNTFMLNGVLVTVSTGQLAALASDIQALSSSTGVNAVLTGTGPYFIQFTAIDARAIVFQDESGNTTNDVGLISVENGTKAAGMFITNGRTSAAFKLGVGYTHTQSVSSASWTIVHNANSLNFVAQVFESAGGRLVGVDDVFSIDANTIQINFGTAQTGVAQLWIFVPPSP